MKLTIATHVFDSYHRITTCARIQNRANIPSTECSTCWPTWEICSYRRSAAIHIRQSVRSLIRSYISVLTFIIDRIVYWHYANSHPHLSWSSARNQPLFQTKRNYFAKQGQRPIASVHKLSWKKMHETADAELSWMNFFLKIPLSFPLKT